MVVPGIITAGVGLFAQDGDGPFSFTMVCKSSVEIYGQGIYRHDSSAGCSLPGGLLMLTRNHCLLFVDANISTRVVLFFFNLYQNRPAVIFSPGRLVSKVAQILLEILPVYVIAVNRKMGSK